MIKASRVKASVKLHSMALLCYNKLWRVKRKKNISFYIIEVYPYLPSKILK